jgi:hypothetical protein
MRIRQTKFPPVRSSLRELPRTAITTVLPRASVNAGDRCFVIRLPAEAFGEGGAFSKQFPPKVPPKQFPRATAFAAARLHTTRHDGHGNWSAPDNNQTKELESSKNNQMKKSFIITSMAAFCCPLL